MNEKRKNPLVPRPPSAIEKAAPGSKRILSGIVADTLALAIKEPRVPPPTKFRIGEDEWCEPDYRQILIWAEESRLKPEEVVTRLLDQQSLRKWQEYPLKAVPITFFEEPLFANGRLLKVVFDLGLLRCGRLEWVNGLEITHIWFKGEPDVAGLSDLGPLPLSRLVALSCSWLGLTRIDLTRVPQLKYLECPDNRLEELQLDCLPQLTTLDCGENKLAELKLDQALNLTHLDCSANRLTHLDLSGLRWLTEVFCGDNKLTKLKLGNLPNMESIECDGNCLHELDLIGVPELRRLDFYNNQLSKLDLSQCPKLLSLDCNRNQLTWLDLSSVQELEYLSCRDNSISELDLSLCPNLTQVDCSGNPISTLDIRGLKHLNFLSCSPYQKVIMDPYQEQVVQDPSGGLEFQIGERYFYGDGVPQDYIEAAKWYRKAANQGHALGQTSLGNLYANGLGVVQDPAEAVKWYKFYRNGADRGMSWGQHNLGIYYWHGYGVAKDMIEAYKWFKLAAEQGHKDAAKELTSITSMLSPGEQQEGDRRYREFKASH